MNWLDRGAASELDHGAAGKLHCGAAGVSVLRTGKALGTGDCKRNVDFSADLTDQNAGSTTLAPRSALLEVHFRARGNTGGNW